MKKLTVDPVPTPTIASSSIHSSAAWAAFTLACRHLELRDLGARTKAAVARAAVAAGSDPDGMAALAALVAGGEYAPLANGLYLIGAAAGGHDVDLSLAAPRLWEGGMFLWLRLPRGLTAARLFPAALERHVAFVPGAPFYAGAPDDRTLRLSFVTVTPEQIDTGIAALAAATRQLVEAG